MKLQHENIRTQLKVRSWAGVSPCTGQAKAFPGASPVPRAQHPAPTLCSGTGEPCSCKYPLTLTLHQHFVHQPSGSHLSAAGQTLAPDPDPEHVQQHWHCSLPGAACGAAVPLPLPEPLPAPGALRCASPGLGPLAEHGAGLRAGCALLLRAHARGECRPSPWDLLLWCCGAGVLGREARAALGGRGSPIAAPLLAFAALPEGAGLPAAAHSPRYPLARFSRTTERGAVASSSRKPSCWSCPSWCLSSTR